MYKVHTATISKSTMPSDLPGGNNFHNFLQLTYVRIDPPQLNRGNFSHSALSGMTMGDDLPALCSDVDESHHDGHSDSDAFSDDEFDMNPDLLLFAVDEVEMDTSDENSRGLSDDGTYSLPLDWMTESVMIAAPLHRPFSFPLLGPPPPQQRWVDPHWWLERFFHLSPSHEMYRSWTSGFSTPSSMRVELTSGVPSERGEERSPSPFSSSSSESAASSLLMMRSASSLTLFLGSQFFPDREIDMAEEVDYVAELTMSEIMGEHDDDDV